MEKRCIPYLDLQRVLEHAESCRLQPNGRWHVVGRDPDGEILRAIVELHDDLTVMTVYRGDE
jgi:nucleotide-binding universal stress UspA family protein